MVEEKACYRHVGEHGQRQRHLGESRVDSTLPQPCEDRGTGKEKRRRGERGNPVQQPGGPKVKERATKMLVLYVEEQPSSLGWGRGVGEDPEVCQPERALKYVATEGTREPGLL